MSLNLVTIKVTKSANSIELSRLLPGVEQDLLTLGVQAANQAATASLKAFQSSVPIFKGQLRNEHMQIQFANSRNLEAKVYVVNQTHNSSPRPTGPRKAYLSSVELALELDKGIHPISKQRMYRSRPSETWPGYSSVAGVTAGWIDFGYKQTLNKLSDLGIM